MNRALLLLLACVPASACGESQAAGRPQAAEIANRPLESFQAELLELAFETATALPVHPHIKSRSRAQETVVAAALELEQPERASRFVERIENWRKGLGYADLAFHFAERDVGGPARRFLSLATAVLEQPEEEGGQAWRKDRTRVRMAQTHLLLGDRERAGELAAGAVDSEAGKLDSVRADFADASALDEHLRTVDAVARTGNFDHLRNALEASTRFFDRFYENEPLRARTEETITSSWQKLPIQVRIELTTDLVDSAIAHEDREKALELVERAQSLLDGVEWTPEARIPLMARLVELRHLAGDAEGARALADRALALYDEEQHRIVDVFRGEALRSLAEAYRSLGRTEIALSLYRRAVAEGVLNPNSRPRAEDLSATCVSMALRGVEPDPDLWARLREIRAALGDPW
jgi:tetratricopeptide (TPR) repeat protein